MRSLAAILLATATSTLYALSTSLQALEARQAPSSSAFRGALLGRLATRRLWLLGAAAGLVAWPLQALALVFGSLALVQPALGLGLVVLLVLGVRLLHEHVGRREVTGVAAIAVAVGVLGWAAPASNGAFRPAGVAVVVAWLVVALALPYVLRRARFGGGLAASVAAGLGWGGVGLATALLDGALAGRHWVAVVLWLAGVGAASWGALLAEMTALQTWPATRAVPVTFALEMAAPAAAAPGLTHAGAGAFGGTPFALALVLACGGAALLGSSRAVANLTTGR
jgi:hypothetical protein